eukprot:Nitzschia sp. Nitz4//scaffold38_size140716//27235//28306//NITZ4_003129-RA/size140716-augustus-gene-0.133-mRNA-1//-1//CDS//3329550024//7854//frame0
MSWFTSGLDTLSKLSETVQNALPVDKELFDKLTLNTDEMKAERQLYGEEAQHKAEVKNMLAGMMPWETKDAERDILVEECKEAILALSNNEETFYGPYEIPALKVKIQAKASSDKEDDDEEENEEETEEHEHSSKKPSESSLEKLSKLEPLPPLLKDFDLDNHVGLIEKLLKADPKLEERQSKLSGGGVRERIFWNNYFFHCAYARYEAGLSIDEIWSFQPESTETVPTALPEDVENEEEVISFEPTGGESTPVEPTGEPEPPSGDATNTADVATASANSSASAVADEGPSSASGTSEFEFVDDTTGGGTGDPELDELEAEIARELEDM